jgi:hypothetical protein
MYPDWLAPLVITVLLFVVTPALFIAWVLYVAISMRQLKEAVAWMAWRMGAPAPQQRGVVTPFRRRSG